MSMDASEDAVVRWSVIDDVIEEWVREADIPNLYGLYDDNLRKELSKRIAQRLNATGDDHRA